MKKHQGGAALKTKVLGRFHGRKYFLQDLGQ
jgi:hypothetical protein